MEVNWERGTIIANIYEVKRLVGQGGMGTVHHVHHLGWDIDLAVKTPNSKVLERMGGAEQFQEREAYQWVRLGLHPNIVSCFYVRVLDDGIPRLFMEFVENGSLKEWMAQAKIPDLNTALDIGVQICWGLGWAHKQGLAHLDIKPSNILMNQDGNPKITDFGLVKATASSSMALEHGGTPGYAAPEQFCEGSELTFQADVYALGVLLYELLQPFMNWQTFSQAATRARPLFYARELKNHTDDLSNALLKSMSLNSEERYTDATALGTALVELYFPMTGAVYSRESPNEARLLADSYNNQAISMLDLNREREAEEYWRQALSVDPQHSETTYNAGVTHWRRGELTDDVLVQQLEAVYAAQPEKTAHLLASVQLERGDLDAAKAIMETRTDQKPEARDVLDALRNAQTQSVPSGRCLRVFKGHTELVHSVCLSVDGQFALSASKDMTLRCWELATGRCLHIFQGHTGPVTSVCISADGHLALSGSEDKTLRLWEMATGQCLRIFQEDDRIASVYLSIDGSWVLSGSVDKTVRLWNVETGTCQRVFQGHADIVQAVCMNANESLVLSGSHDGTIRLWDAISGQCLRVFTGHLRHVWSVCFSKDEKQILSGSWDNTLRLWDVETGNCKQIFHGHTRNVNGVALSNNMRWALSGGMDHTVRLWEVESGRCLHTFKGHTHMVSSVCMSTNGHLALSGSFDGTLRLWQLPERVSNVRFLRLSQPLEYRQLSKMEVQVTSLYKRAETLLQTGEIQEALTCARKARFDFPGHVHEPQMIDLWSKLSQRCEHTGFISGWQIRAFEGHSDDVSTGCLSADGRWALSGGVDKTLRLWEAATGQCLRVFTGHEGIVSSVCLVPDNDLALSASWDNTLRLWDVSTGNCQQIFQGHRNYVNAAALSPDKRWAVSGSGDNTLRLWDIASGQCQLILTGHKEPVRSVCFSADGRWVLSGSQDKTIRLWDVATGRCLHIFQGHTDWIYAVCLSADRRWIISGGKDKNLMLWDATTGRSLRVFKGHDHWVTSVLMTPDMKWALSSSYDNTLRLWEISTGRCLYVLTGHEGHIYSACLSANECQVLSASRDKTLRLWALDWELKAHESADWDEGAAVYLRNFLVVHADQGQEIQASKQHASLKRTQQVASSWSEDDFQHLMHTLGTAGYGWLRPEGVRRKLEEMNRQPGLHKYSSYQMRRTPMNSPNWGPFRKSFVFLILLAVCMFVTGNMLAWGKMRVNGWQKSEATIVSSEFRESLVQEGTIETRFEYTYEYEGEELSATGSFAFSDSDANKVRQMFAPGQTIEILVNSKNYKEVVAKEQFLRAPSSFAETLGGILSCTSLLPLLIGMAIEFMHSVEQFRARNWHV